MVRFAPPVVQYQAVQCRQGNLKITGLGLNLVAFACLSYSFFLVLPAYNLLKRAMRSINLYSSPARIGIGGLLFFCLVGLFSLSSKPLHCLGRYQTSWATYTSRHYGFTVQYPPDYFEGVTITDYGIVLQTPPNIPYSGFGVGLNVGIASLAPHQYGKPVRSFVCGQPVMRITTEAEIAKDIHIKIRQVYFPFKDKQLLLYLEMGDDVVGTAKEKEYIELFETLIQTIQFYAN
jgi:hypothetical protein